MNHAAPHHCAFSKYMEAQRYALTQADYAVKNSLESDSARDYRITAIFINLDRDLDVLCPVLDVPTRICLMDLNKAQWLAYTPCISRASRKKRIDATLQNDRY